MDHVTPVTDPLRDALPVTAGRLAALVGEPSTRPAYAALAAAIRTLAVDGRLPPQVRLPSERELAVALGLSRTTVTRAYAELTAAGWAHPRVGSGTFLALPGRREVLPGALVPQAGVALDLTAAAATCVPGTQALVERAVARLPALLRGPGYEPVGLPALRAAIAARYAARGLPTDPDQLVVTSGALAGIALVARTVLRRGDRALVENPTYPSAVGALRATGARLLPVPVGPRDGLDLDVALAALRAARPRLAYLVPDHHNPTGHVLPDGSRAALAAGIAAVGGTALVDESLAELVLDAAHDGELPAPFAAHLPGAYSVGSLSKPLWGGVRVGWVRCPTAQVAALQAARLTLDLGASALDQLIGTDFLEAELLAGDGPGPLLTARLAGLRTLRDGWLAALAAHAPGWTARTPRGGLALWVGLPDPVGPELAEAALRRGVALAAGPRFTSDGSARDRIRLPLTADVADPAATVRLLVEAYAEVVAGGAAGAAAGEGRGAGAPAQAPPLIA